MSEYENQLAEVKEMLESDPNDESLLQLRDDLLQLIAETREHSDGTHIDNSSTLQEQMVSPQFVSISAHNESNSTLESNKIELNPVNNSTNNTNADGTATHSPPEEKAAPQTSKDSAAPVKKLKKSKKVSTPSATFEVPTHLIPLESDTEAERNKKRRAIKTLKSKWRERVKESTTTKKQKSWQDFVGKGKKKRKPGVNVGGSIFKTEDGVNARVGVIGSGKSMTEFGERKRFKM